ncbi:LysR family transcriptional regulator [Bradyrhizobium prioriisuperbiae]|uniref:LysR family transcriptional regulator n=1 Tax=Bradyrhizobium prioriisuperbiae TaxID=2854389 RepID=UPI0028EB96D4|nr:LysR family transcriptional regulator [Bradyrhizobium prioritasuperba]
MDAADLRVFQAVARTGSMSKAALALNTVQSNVTARIKSLEDELGFALFERTNRGVTLTSAGQRLIPYAERAAHLLDDAKRAVADDGTPFGPLVVGSLDTTAALRLSPILAEFAAAYPAVDLSLKTGTTCELVEQVLERKLDGAYVCGPVNHPDLVVEPFVQEELVVLTSPCVEFEKLITRPDLKIVVLKAGCSYRLRLEALLAQRGIVGVRLLEFGTLEAIVSCVSAGIGLTLLPRAMFDKVWERKRVRIHPLPDGEGWVETVFIRHREALVSSALHAFLDLARLPTPHVVAAE